MKTMTTETLWTRVPTTLIQLQQNLNHLSDQVCTLIPDESAQNRWLHLFSILTPDQRDAAGNLYAGLLTAPASVAAHHNYTGGLVVHYLEMLETAKTFYEVKHPQLPALPFEPSEVLIGILIHDIHKASFNYKVKQDGTGPEYSTHLSLELLPKNARSQQILAEAGIVLTLQQLNVLYNSEGGYNPERPKQCTPLAKFIYLLDEMSANVYDRIAQNRMYHYKTSISISGNSVLNPDGLFS